jgi:hypothetical protein
MWERGISEPGVERIVSGRSQIKIWNIESRGRLQGVISNTVPQPLPPTHPVPPPSPVTP